MEGGGREGGGREWRGRGEIRESEGSGPPFMDRRLDTPLPLHDHSEIGLLLLLQV